MKKATEQRMRAAVSSFYIDGYWPDSENERIGYKSGPRGVVALPTDIWEELTEFFSTTPSFFTRRPFTVGGHVAVHHPFIDEPVLIRSVMAGPKTIKTITTKTQTHTPVTETVWA